MKSAFKTIAVGVVIGLVLLTAVVAYKSWEQKQSEKKKSANPGSAVQGAPANGTTK